MQKETSLVWFKVIAWIVGIYHAILGLIGLFGTPAMIQQVIGWTYRLNPTLDPSFLLLVHFAGSYMLALGVMMILVAVSPKRYGVFIWPAVIMFATRLLDNLIDFSSIQTTFGANATDVLITVILIIFFGTTLIVLRPRD